MVEVKCRRHKVERVRHAFLDKFRTSVEMLFLKQFLDEWVSISQFALLNPTEDILLKITNPKPAQLCLILKRNNLKLCFMPVNQSLQQRLVPCCLDVHCQSLRLEFRIDFDRKVLSTTFAAEGKIMHESFLFLTCPVSELNCQLDLKVCR